ncbi:hypothetical protein LCGC14_1540070 [marine sediment metagenome]|uniref:Uncharacterized protein n=1 Tax=marine sediment metagenome TaxID=412755 RepID=A0A0F9JEA1_9ZZZZ
MALRVVNPQATHAVNICDTTFRVKSMSVNQRTKILFELAQVKPTADVFGTFAKILSKLIVSIDGVEKSVEEFIRDDLEYEDDVKSIITGITNYFTLNKEQVKNSDSLSAQSTADLARVETVEKAAVTEKEPVSPTPIATEQ